MKRFISLLFLFFIGFILVVGNAQAKTTHQGEKAAKQTSKIEKQKKQLTKTQHKADKTVQSARKKTTDNVKSSKKAAGKNVVNINTADANTLQTLPGIGPQMAKKIIAFRKNHKFSSPQDLLQVKGIGEKTLKKLLPLISIR